MRIVVVGLGVQGTKRLAVAGSDVVATVDPLRSEARFKTLEEVPEDSYDAALLCVPDDAKLACLEFLLGRGKHVLVEKPLVGGDSAGLERIAQLSRDRGAVCYTAYNHRFEPHFRRMAELIRSGELGELYHLRMFYGNGTARDVRDSAWRDEGSGVLRDLGSHLLDTVEFWLGRPRGRFRVRDAHRFENRAFDHLTLACEGPPAIELEMSLVCWRNHFTADLYAEKGSAHIDSLCKWGPSRFTVRERVLPSGRPPEQSTTLIQADPTWAEEYAHWKVLCERGEIGDFETERWLESTLGELGAEAQRGATR